VYSPVSLFLPLVFTQLKNSSIRDAWSKNPFRDTNFFDGILSVGQSEVLSFHSIFLCVCWSLKGENESTSRKGAL